MADWKAVRLEEIAIVERGKFSVRPRNDPKYYGGDIPFLQTGDVASATGVILTHSQTLNDEGLKVSKLFPAGTLLITIAANIGDVAEVGFDFACPDSLVAVRPKNGVNKDWLKYFLQTQKSYFESRATQNAQANINLQIVRPLKVHLPPVFEQAAIADLLSTWDSAIEKSEKLITAKEKQFSWLLAQLLKEQSINWQSAKLVDICSIKKGQQLSKVDMIEGGKYYVLNGGITPSGYTDKWNVSENTITISEGGNSCGFISLNKTPFWCGGHCYSLTELSHDMDGIFLYHFLKCHEKRIMRLRVGSGLPNIQRKDVENIYIKFPTISEQRQIAKTLNTARKEIVILNNLADIYRKQKRGLMQKLLIGIWRVKY